MAKKVSDYTPTGSNTGGKTPSFQAKLKSSESGERFQIKRSNYINIFRRWIGIDPDQSDILGEYIASRVTAELLNKNSPPDLAPEVSLIYDQVNNDFCLASKYINDGNERFEGMTMKELAEKKDQLEFGNIASDKKTKLVFGAASNNQLSIDKSFSVEIDGNIEKITINKAELYNTLVASIILGDHDVNMGNFYTIYDKDSKESHVGRIDLGHAFNDLIKNWMTGANTPNISSNRGQVLDFLNRRKQNGGKSKLNRDIDKNIILDADFSKALRNQSDDVSHILKNCEKELLNLMNEDEFVRRKIVNSAKTLQRRIGKIGTVGKISHYVGNIQNKTLRNIVGVASLLVRKIFELVVFALKIPLRILETTSALRGKEYFLNKQDTKGRINDHVLMRNLLNNCKQYITKNQEESKSVANLIDIQIIVNKLFEKETLTKDDIAEAKNKIKSIYEEDTHYLKDKKFKDKVEWVSQDESSKSLKVSLDKYVEIYGDKLGKKELATKIIKSLNEKLSPKKIVNFQDKQEGKNLSIKTNVAHKIPFKHNKKTEPHRSWIDETSKSEATNTRGH